MTYVTPTPVVRTPEEIAANKEHNQAVWSGFMRSFLSSGSEPDAESRCQIMHGRCVAGGHDHPGPDIVPNRGC